MAEQLACLDEVDGDSPPNANEFIDQTRQGKPDSAIESGQDDTMLKDKGIAEFLAKTDSTIDEYGWEVKPTDPTAADHVSHPGASLNQTLADSATRERLNSEGSTSIDQNFAASVAREVVNSIREELKELMNQRAVLRQSQRMPSKRKSHIGSPAKGTLPQPVVSLAVPDVVKVNVDDLLPPGSTEANDHQRVALPSQVISSSIGELARDSSEFFPHVGHHKDSPYGSESSAKGYDCLTPSWPQDILSGKSPSLASYHYGTYLLGSHSKVRASNMVGNGSNRSSMASSMVQSVYSKGSLPRISEVRYASDTDRSKNCFLEVVPQNADSSSRKSSTRHELAIQWDMDDPSAGKKCCRCRCHSLRELVEYALLCDVKALVESYAFDYVSATIIVLNAISIGLYTDFTSRKLVRDAPTHYRVIELVFCFVFAVELALRIFAYRSSFFHMPTWKWNVFDCFLVVMQVSEETIQAFIELTNDDGSIASNMGATRMLRLLRLVRIMRLVRVMHLIGELRILVSSIVNSMRSLIWTLLLLFIIIYIVGVYFCQVVSDHLIENSADLHKAPELREYYGSLLRTVTSLYQAIAGGVSWRDIVDPLEKNISEWLVLPVCLYTAFAILALLNIVTGIFVENAMKSAKKDDDMYLLTDSRKLFLQCCNEDGEISWEAFSSSLDNPYMQNYFKAVDLCAEEAEFLFTILDINESGSLTPDEFVNGCLRLRGHARAIDSAILLREAVQTQRRLDVVTTAVLWMVQQIVDPEEQSSPDILDSLNSLLQGRGPQSGKKKQYVQKVKIRE